MWPKRTKKSGNEEPQKLALTKQEFDDMVASFDYLLPPELIAREPVTPRDTSKLLVYNRMDQSIQTSQFSSIVQYLPKNAVVVFNQTKVIPAKFTLKKINNSPVKALFVQLYKDGLIALAAGNLQPGEKLAWQDGLIFEVIERNNQEVFLRPEFPINDFRKLLSKYGETPLPPYIKDCPLTEEQRRMMYQTVYATDEGSVAAPTAGLHFTEGLMKEIQASGRDIRYVTLHVNLGTFAPLTPANWQTQALHTEEFSIDEETVQFLNAAKIAGRPIVAVGTTCVRTLESAAEGTLKLTKNAGLTDLFITERYHPTFVNSIVTNFHVPRSSLMMLVSAFTGRERLLELYQFAIEKKFRFFSFGDGMLIL